MKKLLLLVIGFAAINSFAAVEYDLRKGIDLTASNYITSSALNQLVDSGTISSTNKGAIIRFANNSTARWPDVTSNPRYTNFIWLDTETAPAVLKSYVCCGDVYTNWVFSGVAPGTITTVEIRDYTILAVDMATNSVPDWAIIAGAVSGNKIADNGILPGKLIAGAVIQGNIAFGAIVGGQITNDTITVTNLADAAVTRPKILNDAIDTTKLTNFAVETADIALTNVNRDHIRNDAIGELQLTNGAVTSNKLAAGTINSTIFHTNVSYGLFKCWAFVNSDGTLLKGLNVASSAKLDTGKYRITFGAGFAPGATNYAALVTTHANIQAALTGSFFSNTVTKVDINIKAVSGGGSGNDTDSSFSVGILDLIQ